MLCTDCAQEETLRCERDKRTFSTIRQLKSKRYQAQYTDMAGNRVPAPHTFMYKVDAEAYLADRRREIEISRYNPSVVKRPKVLFADYANDWLEHRHVNGKPIKPRTREHIGRSSTPA